MYCRLTVASGATRSALFQAIIAVLTGLTDKYQLPAGIDIANSFIISDDPTGWSLYDANFATNKTVLAYTYDDGTKSYVLIDFNLNNSSGYYSFFPVLYELWDSVTHVGTNAAMLQDTGVSRPAFHPTQGWSLFIQSSNGNIFAWSRDNNGNFNSGGPMIITCRERKCDSDTVARAMPRGLQAPCDYAFTTGAANYGFWSPRLKTTTATDQKPCLFYVTSPMANPANTAAFLSTIKPVLDANLNQAPPMIPIYSNASVTDHSFTGGRIMPGAFITTSGTLAVGQDALQYNGRNYAVSGVPGNSAFRLALPMH